MGTCNGPKSASASLWLRVYEELHRCAGATLPGTTIDNRAFQSYVKNLHTKLAGAPTLLSVGDKPPGWSMESFVHVIRAVHNLVGSFPWLDHECRCHDARARCATEAQESTRRFYDGH